MDVIRFFFTDFWHFIGLVIVLGILCRTLVALWVVVLSLVAASRGERVHALFQENINRTLDDE